MAINSREIFISQQALLSLPTSGAAWENVLNDANTPTPSTIPDVPNLAVRDGEGIFVLAKAFVYARTAPASPSSAAVYRNAVQTFCSQVIGTNTRKLSTVRQLPAYVVAADLVGLDGTIAVNFLDWIEQMIATSGPLSGISIKGEQEQRPNNFHGHATASRVANAVYAGDTTDLNRAADVFHGYLGDRTAYNGFKFGLPKTGEPWHVDPNDPVAINPVGGVLQGRNVDGVITDDQRRTGGFAWPPPCGNYTWGAMQGNVVAASVLFQAGFTDVWNWESKALLRAVEWLHDTTDNNTFCKASGDDNWVPHIINNIYPTNFPAPIPAKRGKGWSYTDWTHAGASAPPPSPAIG